MEPTQPVQQPPVAPVQATNPVTPPVVPVSNPEILATPSTPAPKFSTSGLKDKFNSFPKNMRVLLILIPVFFLSLLLLVLSGLAGKVKDKILPTPTPVPTATPEIPEITNPSAYATDPELLDIEAKLTEFDKHVSQVELREDTIRPPSVDWDVNFNNK